MKISSATKALLHNIICESNTKHSAVMYRGYPTMPGKHSAVMYRGYPTMPGKKLLIPAVNTKHNNVLETLTHYLIVPLRSNTNRNIRKMLEMVNVMISHPF